MEQVAVYIDDVNILGKTMNSIQRNIEVLLEANKETCMEENPETS
jgi:hypothetical protein